MNSLVIYALGFELDAALRGAAVAGVHRYPEGISVSLSGAPLGFLHILHHVREPELFLSNEPVAPAPHARPEMVSAQGKTIRGVRSLDLDRVLIVDLEAGGDWDERGGARLRIDLTPASRPLSLFDSADGRPVASIGPKRARRPGGPERLLAPKPYSLISLPAALPADLAEGSAAEPPMESAPEHTRRWRETRSLAAALAASVAGVDPVLAGAVARAVEGSAVRAWELLAEIARILSERRWSWRAYRFPEAGAAGSPAIYPIELPLPVNGEETKGFAEALAARAAETVLPSYAAHLRRRATQRARRDIKRLERLRENLTGDLADAARSAEYRHFGDLLVTYRHLLRAGMREIVVKDFSGDREVRIPLDPARSPDRNVRFYFTKAKKGEKGRLIIRDRKRAVEREIEERHREIERIEALRSPAEILPFVPPEAAPRAGGEQEPPRRFRRFRLDDRHVAYVGRSDEENDFLTHEFASPGDLWFHAQGVSGSHVVLKGAHHSTPGALVEAAAAIAAYFSKAKGSRTVPVICAAKRYVRKPRKSKPGTAVCLRGKTLFVKPELPAGGEEK